MNFTKTTTNDFTILKNGVDERLEIIQHKETGYYNVTKTAKLIHTLKMENEAIEKRQFTIIQNPIDTRMIPLGFIISLRLVPSLMN